MLCALRGVDLFVANEKEPSPDDWGSQGSSIGKISCGLFCHDLLARTFAHALPNWATMSPPENDRASDSAQAYRQRIQKTIMAGIKSVV